MKEKISNLLIWSQKYTKTDMKYAAKGGFWLNLGKTGGFLVTFVTLIAFSRFVTQETYGAYQYVISTMGLFAVFALPGINTALVKSIVQKKEGTLEKGLKEKLKYSLLGSLPLLAISLYYFFRGNNIFGLTFLSTSLLFPLYQSTIIFTHFWQAKKNFKKKSLYDFLSHFFSALLVIPAIYYFENIFLIILVYLISHSFFRGIFLLKTLKQTKNKEIDESALTFGKHLSLIQSIPSFVNHLDRVILWHFLGPIQVAVYSFGYLPVKKIQQLFPISQLTLPKLGDKDIRKIKAKIVEKTKILFLLMIPIVIILYFLASFFYQVFFPQYLNSIVYFQAFLLLLFILPFTLINSALIVELKKKEMYIANIASALLKLTLFLTLIPFFQIWGAVLAILIATFLKEVIYLYFFWRL